MSNIRKIRESIDTKLDRWEADATALEAQLDLNKEKAMERLEAHKQRLSEVLQKFKDEIDKLPDLAQEIKANIQSQIDHLRVQLALGKAEARDAYDSQKAKIHKAIISFKASIDREIEGLSETVMKELVAAENTLDAELDALAAQFELEKTKQQAGFEEKKKELAEYITRFRADLEAKRQKAGDKLAAFEEEVSPALNDLKKAFSKLFS